jgi:sigma-B regulation protein RsbU (phosphoserine phosphatase)
LRYANCGHPAGLVVQHDGTVTRLPSTAPVLGLFADWTCSTAEIQLRPGDLFAIYTDGVTEALDQRDEEFGEDRLLDVMRNARHRSPSDIVTAVFDEVRRFGGDQQRDDVTLIVARCRSRDAAPCC